MLAVFGRRLNINDPLSPKLPGPEYIPALKDGYLEKYFASIYKNPVIINLGTYGFLAYSTDNGISPSPRPICSLRCGVYCIYRGHMEMTKIRKKASKGLNEVDFLMSCYAGLVWKGKHTSFEAMKVLDGNYNYILYDSVVEKEGPLRGALAHNGKEDMSLYYGLDSEGYCIVSDDVNIMKMVCGDSFKLIPKGHGLFIPVLTESKLEPTEASALNESGSKKESAEDTTEASALDESGSKKESAEDTTEAGHSDGSSSVVEVTKGEANEAKSLDDSMSKKGSEGESGATSSSDGGSSTKNASEEEEAAMQLMEMSLNKGA